MCGSIIMNKKVKDLLIYTGIAGALISAIAYIIITYTIIVGFTTAIDMQKQILFAVLGSLTGLMITFFLRNQGITFAEKEEESIKTMTEYHHLINKTKKKKKLHTIKYFMVVSTIQDIFYKGLTIAGSTYMIMFIFMEGNGDWSLFRLALSNIFMFAGFGLVALSKAYDHYVDQHIPVIKELIERIKEETKENEHFQYSNEFMKILKQKLDQVAVDSDRKSEENANIQQRELQITSTTSGEKQTRHPIY